MGLDAGVSYSQNLSSVTRGYAVDGTGGHQDVNYNDGETLNLHLGMASESVNDREGSTGCFYRRARDKRTVRSIHPDGFLSMTIIQYLSC